MFKNIIKNWKTTSTGVITIAGAIATLVCLLVNSLHIAIVIGCVVAIAAGVGQILSQDATNTPAAPTV